MVDIPYKTMGGICWGFVNSGFDFGFVVEQSNGIENVSKGAY